MAVTNYHTVNGRILGETTGGVRTDYLTDALGSVTATVNSTAQIINRYAYKPYGGLLAKTGVGADPVNQWVGSLGYRQTGKKYSDVYVRARHYDTLNGRWTSKDPIGFNGGDWNLFRYAVTGPAWRVDPTGLSCSGPGGCVPDKGTDCYTIEKGCCEQDRGNLQPKDSLSFSNVLANASTAVNNKASCLKSNGQPLTKQQRDILAAILACTALQESGLNPHCFNDRGGEPADTYGLYQVNKTQWDQCSNGGKLCDPQSNTNTAFNLILRGCGFWGKQTILDGLCSLFGVWRVKGQRDTLMTCAEIQTDIKRSQIVSLLASITCSNCNLPKNCNFNLTPGQGTGGQKLCDGL
jgi:RHS repeat-associated protein